MKSKLLIILFILSLFFINTENFNLSANNVKNIKAKYLVLDTNKRLISDNGEVLCNFKQYIENGYNVNFVYRKGFLFYDTRIYYQDHVIIKYFAYNLAERKNILLSTQKIFGEIYNSKKEYFMESVNGRFYKISTSSNVFHTITSLITRLNFEQVTLNCDVDNNGNIIYSSSLGLLIKNKGDFAHSDILISCDGWHSFVCSGYFSPDSKKVSIVFGENFSSNLPRKNSVLIYDIPSKKIKNKIALQDIIDAKLSPDNNKLLVRYRKNAFNFNEKTDNTKQEPDKIYIYNISSKHFQYIGYGLKACWVY